MFFIVVWHEGRGCGLEQPAAATAGERSGSWLLLPAHTGPGIFGVIFTGSGPECTRPIDRMASFHMLMSAAHRAEPSGHTLGSGQDVQIIPGAC